MTWITDHPTWAGLVIFVIAFIESLVVIGFFLPGIFILFGVGALIGMGVTETLPIWVGGSLGAFFGDILSFYLGHRYQHRLRHMWPFSRYPGMLVRGSEFFRRHGAKSVLAGRFIGPLRPVIPTTAGMLGMPFRRFLAVCIPGCILWTPAYLVPGMLFGASLEVASDYAGRLALVVAMVVAIVWLSLWFFRLLYELSAVYSARWMRRAIRWTRRHPVLGRLTGPIIDPAQPEVLSVSMLGVLLVVALSGLVLLMFMAPFGAEPGKNDLAVLIWTQTLRNDITDPVMVAVSQLSRWWVLVPTCMATLLWLLGAERKSAAAHWVVAIAGGVALHYLMSWALRTVPLDQLAGVDPTFLPSAPLTLSTVVLGFFSVMVAKELKRRHRKWPYLGSTLLLTVLVMARIYLGLDWLSGALLGFALGLAWTAIVGMAYRARALRTFSGSTASIIFYGTLSLTMAWQVPLHMQQDLEAVRIPVKESPMSLEQWWATQWAALPAARTISRSPAARQFNVQVAAPQGVLRRQLLAQGWESVDNAGWRWILQSINPEANQRTLPLTGRNFLGQGEVLVLRRMTDDPARQRVLRLWDSGVRLGDKGRALYLGQYNDEVLQKRLWMFSHWQPQLMDRAGLAEFGESLDKVEQRMARDGLLLIRPRLQPESGGAPPAEPAGDQGG